MIIGSTVIYKKSLPHSIRYAKDHLDRLLHGTVIVTDHLEVARGRQGRTWRVDEGQLLLTLVLKPQLQNPDLSRLSMALSYGIACGLSEYDVALKWPNDFVINKKKVGGIITESLWSGSCLIGIVVGIGLNVNNHFEQSDELYEHALSLRDYTKKTVDKNKCLNALIVEMNKAYNQWEKGEYESIFKQWKNKQVFLGRRIIVHDNIGNKISGVMKNIDSNGDIILSISQKYDKVIPFYLAWEIFMV